MTWLPVERGELGEREAVLGLRPDVYGWFRNIYAVSWQIADSRLLDLCRLRLA